MQSISSVIRKVMPKLAAIEDNPTVVVLKEKASTSTTVANTPWSTATTADGDYDTFENIPCVYSEQPEVAINNNQLITSRASYLYIVEQDLPSTITKLTIRDRFVFKNDRYKPVDIQLLFGLWKIRINKQS